MEIKVTSKYRHPSQKFTSAAVVITEGKTKIELGLSKYDHETEWYLDYQFINSIPDFCHGEGSRGCMKRPAKPILKEAIEKAEIDD